MQRTCFAQSIIHDPDLLILDEPTDGLDPNQKLAMQSYIQEIGCKKGILLSTHILSEAEAICDRILVLNQGKLLHDGTVASLRKHHANEDSLHITVRHPYPREAASILREIPEISQVTITSSTDDTVSARLTPVNPSTDISLNVLNRVIMEGWPVLRFNRETSTLTEAFASLTQEGSQHS